MIVIFLGIIVGAIFIAKAFCEFSLSTMEWIGHVIMGVVLGGMLGGCIGVLVSIGIAFAAPEETIYQETKKIVAAKDNITIEGHFFIGGGTIDGDMYYFYYTQSSYGYYESHKIKAKHTRIYEDEELNPYIKLYRSQNAGALKYFAIPWFTVSADIHIPRGSIVQKINFDLE